MNWLIPGAILLTIALPANQYLIAINRQRRALAAVVAAIGVSVAANHAALSSGWGLSGVAMATLGAYACYWCLIVGVSLWADLAVGERLRYLGITCLALLPTLSLAWWFARCGSSDNLHLSGLVVQSLVVVLVWLASTAAAWHVGGWREQLAR
jgi:hypothetical protein